MLPRELKSSSLMRSEFNSTNDPRAICASVDESIGLNATVELMISQHKPTNEMVLRCNPSLTVTLR
jgi:hypothetical protein